MSFVSELYSKIANWVNFCIVIIAVFCFPTESKVLSEDCDEETTEDTPAADTKKEMADDNQKSESTQEDSSTQNSTKKKKKRKKRKLNEAEDPTNSSEFILRLT